MNAWLGVLYAIGAGSQFALLAHHLQRGESWAWDLAVGVLCVVALLARQLRTRGAR